ncbi:MAG: hypothetical protein ACJAYH_001091 [Celeribacter sp.]|jgi:hypothetical protein
MNFLVDQIIAPLAPLILTALSAFLTTIIYRVSVLIKARWGIEIEASHRKALHSALMSGIRAAVARSDGTQDAIASAIRYAGSSVPDAILALRPSSEVLASIAEAKLQEVATEATAMTSEVFKTSHTQG